LGAFTKYPKESLPIKPNAQIASKKYGFFQTEKNSFLDVANELGLKKLSTKNIQYSRHPLAFLVEAADDICYTIIDFEDGINLGLIEEDFALEYLINLVRDTINTKKYSALNTKKERVSYLRALAISTLIEDAVNIFMTYENEILEGEFHVSILDKSKYQAQINDIIKLSVEKIYNSDEVIDKEISGFEILNQLLDRFILAANNNYKNTPTSYDKLLLKLIPNEIDFRNDSLYIRMLNVCYFVSLFSDTKAVLTYKKIKGLGF
jgi:dGTPase